MRFISYSVAFHKKHPCSFHALITVVLPAQLQPSTKIVGKAENERLDFNNIQIDLIYSIGTQKVFMSPPLPHINVEVLVNICDRQYGVIEVSWYTCTSTLNKGEG